MEKMMDLENRIIEIIARQLAVPREKCTMNATFIDDLEADSVEIIELVYRFEQEFSVKISDGEIYKIRTIRDACDTIKRKTG
jgi:acyl carrier protein